jgi:hypothetical protein
LSWRIKAFQLKSKLNETKKKYNKNILDKNL